MAAYNTTKPQVTCHAENDRNSMANPVEAGLSRPQSAGVRRQVSLYEAVHHLSLAEQSATDRQALKTALNSLSTNDLKPADFIVLVNRYGYCLALHSFVLDTLQPADWLALTERACEQIVQHHGSLLAQLPPAAITCKVCMAAYISSGAKMFKQVPAHLRDSFFTRLIARQPLDFLSIAPAEQTFERCLQACCANRLVLFHLPCEQRTVKLVTEVCRRTGHGLKYLPQREHRPATPSDTAAQRQSAKDSRSQQHIRVD